MWEFGLSYHVTTWITKDHQAWLWPSYPPHPSPTAFLLTSYSGSDYGRPFPDEKVKVQ